MSDPTLLDSEIDQILDDFNPFNISYNDYTHLLPKAKQAIKNLLLEARLDEIGAVKTEYGHYIAETYINGKAMTVQERYEQLQEMLK
jgi:hypothetical protein